MATDPASYFANVGGQQPAASPPASGDPSSYFSHIQPQAAAQPSGSWFGHELAGAGAAAGESFGDLVLGGQELIGHALRASGFDGAGDWLVNDAQAGAKKLKGEAEPYRKAAPTGAFVGDVAGNLPVAMGVGELGIASKIGEAAVSGATSGALQPTGGKGNFAAEKGKQIGLGAAGGAAAGTAGKVLSSAIAPKLAPDAAALVAKGVQLTPGQMMGGAAKRAEDSLSSVPVVGSFIGSAQRKSLETFNRAVIDDALSPIGEKLPKPIEMGRSAVSYAADKISDAYNTLLPKMVFRADTQFDNDLVNLRTLAQNMPPDQARQFEAIIRNNLVSRLEPTGTMLGGNLKIVESDLGKLASDYRGSSVASERQLGDAIREAQNIVRQTLVRQNPTHAAELQSINSAFARLVRVEGAAGNRSTSGGVFTPGDLLTAIKRADQSSRKAQFSTGNSLGQSFAESGQAVLPQKTPNSGTPERAMWAGLLGGEYLQNPRIALGLGGATLPYTNPVLGLMNRAAQPAGPGRAGAAQTAQTLGSYAAPAVGADMQSILSQLGIAQ
jgi:hypothetical protein